MVKYLVGILCSSNIPLLRESLNSVINQQNFDDYHIFIIVNTLDEVFYQDVIREFGYNKHDKLKKIIRTESNGFPGKGHNSVLDIFYKNYKYDYLIKLDGDDFLFPTAIERINNVQVTENSDVISLLGNCSVINTGFNYSKEYKRDPDTNIRVMDYKIQMGFEIKEVGNIMQIDESINTLDGGTPMRLLCLNRKILDKYKKLYNEDMFKCVDIEYCVIFYRELYETNYKITHLTDPYVYLYNGINENSVTTKHDNVEFAYYNDERIRNGLLQKYQLSDYRISEIKPVVYQHIIQDNIDMNMIQNYYDKMLFTLMRINNQYITN
jgi:hypothetical protein